MTRRETAFGAGVAYPRPRPGLADGAPSRTSNWPPLGWVHGHTTSRLYGYLGDLPAGRVRGKVPRYPAGGHGLVEIK
jgi:hypothetical protein